MSIPYVSASTPQYIVLNDQQQQFQQQQQQQGQVIQYQQQPHYVQTQIIGQPVQQQQFQSPIPQQQQQFQNVVQYPQQILVQQQGQNVIRPGSPQILQQHQLIPSQQQAESYLSQSNGKLSTNLGYIGNGGNVLESTQQIQQRLIQHRGVGGQYPDQLASTVNSRNGGLQHHFTPADFQQNLQEYPSHISEYIQRRPHAVLDSYQDTEGLDIIRVQATRISNLLDRIEILEKELERQVDLLAEKDDNLIFWTQQYERLEYSRKQSISQVDSFSKPEDNKQVIDSIEDKNKIEKKLTLKLREIEDCNNEIAYWKSHCIPNEDSSQEIKRLQQKQDELNEQNREINKQLLITGHQSRLQ